MCTVTIVPIDRQAARSNAGGTVRLACNRDELRSRPAALPPQVHRLGMRTAIMPIDPVSGGTWIGVNDAGLVATVLNVNRDVLNGGGRGVRSRGLLVPRLMACSTIDDAQSAAGEFTPEDYPPFRLVLIDAVHLVEVFSDGRALRRERRSLGDRPLLFTSSGLGDARVEGPRRELFEQMFTRDADWTSQQFRFHRHAWPDRAHLSVCMQREAARTVSHTVIDLAADRAVLTYVPDAPDRAQPLAPLSLDLSWKTS